MRCIDGTFENISGGIIDSGNYSQETFFTEQKSEFLKVIKDAVQYAKDNGGKVLVTKERLPNQSGKFSTISTLQSLAQTHAIFQLALEESGADCYDYDGIHSTSVKAWARQVGGYEKPTKEDVRQTIADYIGDKDIETLPLDITDAMGIILTLYTKKWNDDLTEGVRNVKREIKKFKSDKKIAELKEYIEKLEEMKIG